LQERLRKPPGISDWPWQATPWRRGGIFPVISLVSSGTGEGNAADRDPTAVGSKLRRNRVRALAPNMRDRYCSPEELDHFAVYHQPSINVCLVSILLRLKINNQYGSFEAGRQTQERLEFFQEKKTGAPLHVDRSQYGRDWEGS
jgi:hypothetical protein